MTTVLIKMVAGKLYFKVNTFLCFGFSNSKAEISFLIAK